MAAIQTDHAFYYCAFKHLPYFRSTVSHTMYMISIYKYLLNKWIVHVYMFSDIKSRWKERICKTQAYPRGDEIQGYNNTNNDSNIITDN